MQKRNIILLLCALIIPIISACQSETISTPPSSIPWTSTAPSASTPVDTASIQQEKQAILQEIYTLVDQYNAFLEKEKTTGNYMIVQLSDGSEGVQFTNESAWKVFTEMERVDKLIAGLNEKYYELSVKEYPSLAYPNPAIPKDLGELSNEYPAWIDEERKNGSIAVLVTDFGEKRSLFIGDSYVEKNNGNNNSISPKRRPGKTILHPSIRGLIMRSSAGSKARRFRSLSRMSRTPLTERASHIPCMRQPPCAIRWIQRCTWWLGCRPLPRHSI